MKTFHYFLWFLVKFFGSLFNALMSFSLSFLQLIPLMTTLLHLSTIFLWFLWNKNKFIFARTGTRNTCHLINLYCAALTAHRSLGFYKFWKHFIKFSITSGFHLTCNVFFVILEAMFISDECLRYVNGCAYQLFWVPYNLNEVIKK